MVESCPAAEFNVGDHVIVRHLFRNYRGIVVGKKLVVGMFYSGWKYMVELRELNNTIICAKQSNMWTAVNGGFCNAR